MGLSFYTGATGFVGRNLLGALLRETRDDYLVLIRSEKSREIIECGPQVYSIAVSAQLHGWPSTERGRAWNTLPSILNGSTLSPE